MTYITGVKNTINPKRNINGGVQTEGVHGGISQKEKKN